MLAIRCFDRFTSPGNTPDDPEAKIELYDKGKGEKALPRIKLRTKYFSLDPPSTGKPVVQLSSDTYGTTIFHTKREEDRAKLADMITRFIAGKHRPQPAGARPRPSRSGGPRPTVRSQRPQGPARQHGAAGGTPVGQSASGSAAVHPVHPGEQPGRQTLSPAPPQSAGSSSGSGSTTPVRRPTSPALSVSPTATRGAVSSTGSAAAASRTQRSPNKPPAATGRTATQRSSAPRTQTATANVVPAPRRQQQQQSSQAGPAMQGTQRQTALPTGPSMSPPLVASRGVVRQTTLRTPSGPADDSMGIKWAPAKDIANANANANATPFGDDFDGFDDDDDDDDFDDISDDDITTPDEEGASAMSPRGEARRVTLRKRASGADLATTEKLRGGSGPGASGVVMLDGMCANDGEEDMALNKTPDGYGVPTNIEEDNRRDPRLEHGRRPTLTKAKPGDAPYSNEKSATLQFYDKNDPLGLDDDGYGYPEGWDEIKARAKELGWDGEDEDTVASSPAASSTAPAAGGGPPPLVDYQPWVSPAGGQRASTLDGKSDTLLMGKSIAEKIRQEGAAMEAEAARLEREIANEFPSLLRGTSMDAAEKIRQEGVAMDAEAARIEREIANEFPSLLRGTSMEAPARDTSMSSNPFAPTLSQEDVDEGDVAVEVVSPATRQEAELKLKSAAVNGGFIVRVSNASTSGMTISVYGTLNQRPQIRHHLIEVAKGGGVRMPESQRIHADWQALTAYYAKDHGTQGNYFEVALKSLTLRTKKPPPKPHSYPELDPGDVANALANELAKAGPAYAPDRPRPKPPSYPELDPDVVANELANELAKAGPAYAPTNPNPSLYCVTEPGAEAASPPASAVVYSASPQTFASTRTNTRHAVIAEPLYADPGLDDDSSGGDGGGVEADSVPAPALPSRSSATAPRPTSESTTRAEKLAKHRTKQAAVFSSFNSGPGAISGDFADNLANPTQFSRGSLSPDRGPPPLVEARIPLRAPRSSSSPSVLLTQDMYSTSTDESLPEELEAPSVGARPLRLTSTPAAGQALTVKVGHSVTETVVNLPVTLTGHDQLPAVETHGIDPAQVTTLITKMMFKKAKEKKVDLLISNGKFQLRMSRSNPEVYQPVTNIVYSSQCAIDRLAVVFKIGKLYKCYAIKVTDLTHMTLILERIQEGSQAATGLGVPKKGGGIGRNRPTSMMIAKKMATKRRSMKQKAERPEAKMFSFKRHSLTLADVENKQNLADPIGLFRCGYVTGLPLSDFNNLNDHTEVITRKLEDCGSAKNCNPELVLCALTVTPLGLKVIQMDTSEELLDIYVNEIVHLNTITDKRSLRPMKKLKFKTWDQPLTVIVTSKRLGVGGQAQTGCEMLYVEEEASGSYGAELMPLLQEICTRAAHRHGRLRETFLGVPGEENDSTLTEAATGLKMVDRARLDCINVLGRGQYGEVFLASDLRRRQQVAVKMTAGELSVEEASDFLGEAEIMGPLEHPCIIELIGVEVRCQPWLIVLEFCKYGDLRALLKHCGHPNSNKVAYMEQLYCCYQVASALGYVATKRLVHMDVATRNVLVCPKSRVKLADFGIAQKIPVGEPVWTMYDTMKLPARWQAPESWRYKTFGPKTDCWSYGMMCWEVASHGQLPMQELKLQLIPAHVVAGGVPIRVADTPDDFHDLMASCWRSDPDSRPSFEEICATLAKYGAALQANGYTLRDLGLLITSPEEAESTKVPWTLN